MKLNDIFVALSTVDSWSQVSCLGSMHYLVSAQAIREAVPDRRCADRGNDEHQHCRSPS
jgi:hypothetical protein